MPLTTDTVTDGRAGQRLAGHRVDGRPDTEHLVDGGLVLWLGRELDVAVARCPGRRGSHRSPSGSVTTATGRVSWGTELMLTEWKSSTRLAMSLTGQDWSKVRSALHRVDQVEVGDRVPESLLGHSGGQHPEELVVPADAGQVAQGLLGPVLGVGAGRVGDSYWRWRARTTSRAWVPLRWTQVAAWTLRPEMASKTDIGKDMLMPPRASTTLANWSKLSETACWMGIPKSSSMAATSWVRPW